MDDNRLDPETEKALKAALDQAEQDVRADGILSMSVYLWATYESWLKVGFNKKQAYKLTEKLYEGLLRR